MSTAAERWRRIEEVLDGALDLPPEERPAWLARECAGDAALRGEVEALLTAGEQPTRLPRSPADLAAPLVAELTGDGAGPAPERVGPWRIVRELGHGGMGTVYLAERDDDQFRKQVAVKVLRPGLAAGDLLRRFRHERQILATLDHPNIARLLDGGIAAGAPYIVMEYVDGSPLDEHCARQRLSIPDRIALFAEACGAVQYAHQHLVVHRDLKPSNILVTGDGRVKLLDFGIAKLLGGEEAGEAPLTRTGMHLMTPEYAAPEQVRGGAVTTATDVYALGVVLYELLAGRRPYEVEGRSLSEIERLICETEPVRPSTGAVAEPLRRRLRGDLDTIVMKALRKEPERRYPSAAALLEDLERWRRGLPVHARPDTFRYRARKFAARHRLAVGLSAAALALVVGAALRERELRAEAEAETAKARTVQDFLVGVFEAPDPYAAAADSNREVTAQTLLDRGRSRVDSALGSEPEVHAEMLAVLGRVYANLGQYGDAAPLLERSLERRRDLRESRPESVAETMTELGDVYHRQGKYADAERLLREALEVRRTPRNLDRLATVLQQQGRLAEAEPLFREALAERTRLLGARHVDVSESMANLALLHYLKNEFDSAYALDLSAMEIRRERLGPRHVLVAEVMHNLAQVQQFRGNMEEAESLYRESLAMKRETFGDVHPRVTVHLNNYGRLLRDRGRPVEAEPLFREALALDRKIFGEEHPYVAASLDNLAGLLGDLGRFDEADSLAGRALAINRKLLGERHPTLALNLNTLGVLRQRRGDLAGAERLLRDAVERYRERYGPDHASPAAVASRLAGVLRERGALAEAEQLFRESTGKLEAGLPATQLRLAPALTGFGLTLLDAGRAEEARPVVERALNMLTALLQDGDWRSAEARLALGRCLAALGRRDEGRPLVRQAREALQPVRAAHPRLAREADSVWAEVEK